MMGLLFHFKGEREKHRKGNGTVTQDEKTTLHTLSPRPLPRLSWHCTAYVSISYFVFYYYYYIRLYI